MWQHLCRVTQQGSCACTVSHALGIHPVLNEPVEEPHHQAAAQEPAHCGRTPHSTEHRLEPQRPPAPRLCIPSAWDAGKAVGPVQKYESWQHCQVSKRRDVGQVDEFLHESCKNWELQDWENSINSFPVGNLLVGWCSVSAICSVAVNRFFSGLEGQGNKLRGERK